MSNIGHRQKGLSKLYAFCLRFHFRKPRNLEPRGGIEPPRKVLQALPSRLATAAPSVWQPGRRGPIVRTYLLVPTSGTPICYLFCELSFMTALAVQRALVLSFLPLTVPKSFE